LKILIAEDDLTTRTILRGVLVKWGYEVITANNGKEAWERLQELDAPQLALLDWMMPEMNGPELCQKLRTQERPAPLYIILLTSKGDREDIIEGLGVGADEYITKPYNNEELRARIKVGQRILELQSALIQKEKLQGVLEMAGAVCHELNQPLQTVSGWAELLLLDLSDQDPHFPALKKIKEGVDRAGSLTRKIMRISQYQTKDYLGGGSRIIDLDKSTKPLEGFPG